MLTKAEKEALIIRLLREGKNYKEITKQAHASCTQISLIRKKIEGEDSEPNVRTKSYQMFEEKKQPIDVAIELQIDNFETLKYYREYLQLKRENKILEIRDELGDDFIQFVNLYKEMKSKNYSLDEMKEGLRIGRKTEEALTYLAIIETDKERSLEAVRKLNRELSELHKKISVAEHELERLESIKRPLIFFVESRAQENTKRNLPHQFNTVSREKRF
jgi:transposase